VQPEESRLEMWRWVSKMHCLGHSRSLAKEDGRSLAVEHYNAEVPGSVAIVQNMYLEWLEIGQNCRDAYYTFLRGPIACVWRVVVEEHRNIQSCPERDDQEESLVVWSELAPTWVPPSVGCQDSTGERKL
jgi:hypothetical protein